jgi:hypothetical protein
MDYLALDAEPVWPKYSRLSLEVLFPPLKCTYMGICSFSGCRKNLLRQSSACHGSPNGYRLAHGFPFCGMTISRYLLDGLDDPPF